MTLCLCAWHCQLRDAARTARAGGFVTAGDPNTLPPLTFCSVCWRSVSLPSSAAVQEWGEDAVGQGTNLLAQSDVFRVTCGADPNPWLLLGNGAGEWEM